MASTPPRPNLGKSQALNVAQTTVQRLATIVPSLTTVLSPVTVYQPGASGGVGNQLIANANVLPSVSGSYGVWVAPDLLGNGQEYSVQVECFGAGGGGGGGSATGGGGGGGGGEYACETQYPVKPGVPYAYVVGLPGSGGYNNSTTVNPGAAGTDGGLTQFDTDHGLNANSLANGVIANGGQGGDQTAVGVGGAGGSGSPNSIHFNGGTGGTNTSLSGGDNPIALAQVSGMFVGNTLSKSIISDWLITNDVGSTGGLLNDNTGGENWGYVTNYSNTPGGPGYSLAQVAASSQIPAYASAANPPTQHNATAAGEVGWFKAGAVTTPACVIEADAVFAGSKLTISCWLQCDASGTWGNTASGSYAVIAANTENYNGQAMQGYAIYLHQDGPSNAPSWGLYAAVGNGSSRTIINYNPANGHSLPATPGTWYYVVMTYNSGTLTLYVNGSSVGTATSSGYTSVPGGGYSANIGMDPAAWTNWFFGSVANIWWANDCATSTLITQAYTGGTPATGGAGGGASGGPSAAGGTGNSAIGTSGGAYGTPATQPASLVATTTEAMSGYPGANAGSGYMLPGLLGITYTTVTKTAAGTYQQTLPEGVTTITAASCWGAGSGGAGGTTSGGGSGGSGGEYAAESTYTPLNNPFTYVVGAGGSNSSTGNGAGGNGGDSFIDDTGIYAHGGTSSGGTGSTNTTHHNGGTGGTASSTGGASGGNSGNSTAAGNAGTNSSSSTGGASPSGQSGSGTGGAGGNNNASGGIGGSPGGGGGGAGAGTSSQTTLTKTYEAVYTASYYGPDAQNGDPNGLRSTSVLYQGGETSDGGEYNGNQRCVMVFNSDQIQDDFAGYTPTGLSLTLTNQHSWYNSGMTVEIDVGSDKYPGSAPGTWQGNQNFLVTTSIAEGATHTYALGASCASYFTNNETNFLGLGAYVASDHPYNLNYYGFFTGGHGTALEITITGTQSSAGSENSGAGRDGEVTFTYADSAPPPEPPGTIGGPYGGGGGGSGNMAASPALTVLTVPFSSAATYCGIDAGSGPGTPYSVNLQNNPASGVNTVLFSGGAASDSASGTKNSILLLPPTLQGMLGSGQYTIGQIFLTFTNALPNNSTEPILELGYSGDTSLPQTYSGESLAGYIGAVPIASGAGTITYDLTQSHIGTYLQNGTATALVIGPGATPTFDAYNAPFGAAFYCSIYGPGAYDSFGNAQYPYLTIVLQKTLTTQHGSAGAGGAIIITALNNTNTFVSSVQPYVTTDEGGNLMGAGYTGPTTAINQATGLVVSTTQSVSAVAADGGVAPAGYTGPVVSYDPTLTTPALRAAAATAAETWKTVTLPGSGTFTGTIRYKRVAESNFACINFEFSMTPNGSGTPGGTTANVNAFSTGAMLSPYWPTTSQIQLLSCEHGSPTTGAGYYNPYTIIGTNGVIQLVIPNFPTPSGATAFNGTIIYPLD